MSGGIPRSLYAPKWNGQADGGLSIGEAGLTHAAAAKSMAEGVSGTSPWNTEVWCVPDKHEGARRELEARARGMAMFQEIRLKDPKTSSGLGSRMQYG